MKGGGRTTSSTTVASTIGLAGDIVTEALSWVTESVTTMTENPLIMTFVLVAFVGLGVGMIRRMIRL